jgi:hypothetical protein
MLEKMENKILEFKELYPKIIVYKNMFSEIEKMNQVVINSEKSSSGKYYFKDWTRWAVFGTYTQKKNQDELYENTEMYENEKFLDEVILKASKNALAHYKDYTNLEMPEGCQFNAQSFSKYDTNVEVEKSTDLVMNYHTDFIISEKDMPGNKFLVTCTTYLNDDYEGGEVEYYINGDVIKYKPEKGDILMFPSGLPYYHGVKQVTKGNKYFVRNFVTYPFAGEEQWLKNQMFYGAYRWSKMEWERCERENSENMLWIKNGQVISYAEVEAERNKQNNQ